MPRRLGDVSLGGWEAAGPRPRGIHRLPPQEASLSPQTEEGKESQAEAGSVGADSTGGQTLSVYTRRLHPQIGGSSYHPVGH